MDEILNLIESVSEGFPSYFYIIEWKRNSHIENYSARFKFIKRHKTDLKWIKVLQTPFPLGFNDYIYHEVNIFKMADFYVFSV